jgi:hypothetical protein
MGPRPRTTAPSVRTRKVRGGDAPLVMVTAYDAPGARMADEAGVDLLLVGDSVAMVVLGYDDTLQVTVDDIAHHTAAVARTAPAALVVADLPWLSYHVSVEDTVRNAATLVRAGATAVKLEGGAKRVPMVEALVAAEIPVMGHIGLTPQSVHAMGGFKVQGKDAGAAAASSTTPWPSSTPGRSPSCSRASRRRGPHGHRRRCRCRPSASAPVVTATARCSCSTTCSASRTARRRSSSALRRPQGAGRRRAGRLRRRRPHGAFPSEAETYHLTADVAMQLGLQPDGTPAVGEGLDDSRRQPDLRRVGLIAGGAARGATMAPWPGPRAAGTAAVGGGPAAPSAAVAATGSVLRAPACARWRSSWSSRPGAQPTRSSARRGRLLPERPWRRPPTSPGAPTGSRQAVPFEGFGRWRSG